MATDHAAAVSKENLDRITKGSFAVNAANFRSLLLAFEREARTATDLRRIHLVLNEVLGLQAVFLEQIKDAGADTSRLGVPPSELAELPVIFERAMAAVSTRYVALHWFIMDPALDRYLVPGGERLPGPGSAFDQFVALATEGRAMLSAMLIAPENGYKLVHRFEPVIEQVRLLWQALQVPLPMVRDQPSAGGPPPAPPSQPPAGSGGGGDDVPRRLDRLETKVDKLDEAIIDIKGMLARMDEAAKHWVTKTDLEAAVRPLREDVSEVKGRLDSMATKEYVESALKPVRDDVATIKERLTHMASKDDLGKATLKLYVAGGTAVAVLLTVLAKGFNWV